VKVEIWSDIVCPWCAIGKRRFEAALARFDHRDEVEVRWRSFELDPAAPSLRAEPLAEHLAAKYGVELAQAEAMQAQMTATAEAEGLSFRFDIARAGNTFDAHRLLHLAADHGLQDTLKERLLSAYLGEGEPVGDRATLARLAAEAGLDRDDAAAVLGGDAYADAVRADEADGRALGISGVPFFVIERTYGVSGAQSPDVLVSALDRAWADRHPLTVVAGAGGGDCADGACTT
jgi:predicted DsbA family dithiol-disulfide isomerase